MTRRNNRYDWEAVVAETRRRPFAWLPMFPDAPAHLVDRIRRRRHRALRRDDGTLEATIVNKYQVPGFAARGDVWVRWVPIRYREE